VISRDEFAKRLERRPMLADGAMGTLLYERGVFINRSFEEACLSQPALVRQIHADYIRAGAELIETNSYGANRLKLKNHGLEERVAEINAAAARLAREAAGTETLVAGAVGPLGLSDPAADRPARPEMEAIFEEQIAGLIEGGVDLFILETHYALEELEAALAAIRRRSGEMPVIAQVTVREDGYSSHNLSLIEAIRRLSRLDVDMVGLNCTLGPRLLLDQVRQMAEIAAKPMSAMPNAGAPTVVEGRYLYMSTPEYVAGFAQKYIELGVRLVGGCCGTNPEHIRQMGGFLASRAAGRVEVLRSSEKDAGREQAQPKEPLPAWRKSPFAYKLRKSKRYVTSVEVSPPKGADLRAVVEKVKQLQAAGIDVINIPDGPRAVARMTPVALGSYLERVVGMETVLHYTCRDRNLLGMQADLIGMNALGVRNVILITGDPPKMGDYPNATGVFDVDSIGLARILQQLNRSLDMGGHELAQAPVLHYGVGCEPGAANQERETARLAQKLEAGAEFIMTQPVYDTEMLANFLARADVGDTPILVGILPLASYRNAQFLHYEVPGMRIPDPIRERMKAAGSGAAAQEEGVRIAREAVEAAKDLPNVRGFYVMPPLGRYHLALDVLSPVRSGGEQSNYEI